jgi:hypothetical protein
MQSCHISFSFGFSHHLCIKDGSIHESKCWAKRHKTPPQKKNIETSMTIEMGGLDIDSQCIFLM